MSKDPYAVVPEPVRELARISDHQRRSVGKIVSIGLIVGGMLAFFMGWYVLGFQFDLPLLVPGILSGILVVTGVSLLRSLSDENPLLLMLNKPGARVVWVYIMVVKKGNAEQHSLCISFADGHECSIDVDSQMAPILLPQLAAHYPGALCGFSEERALTFARDPEAMCSES